MITDRFDREAAWGHLRNDAETQRRFQMLIQMIPQSVERIVDVGCGDGAITNQLADRWEVTGVDRSEAALAHLETTAVRASATHLPFESGSVDLVLSSEMLEHLDDRSYRLALDEMYRISRRYILLTVPYREDLQFRQIRCSECGWRGHVWGHRRAFTPESLLRDLDGCAPLDVRIFGPLQHPKWPAWLLWPIQHVLHGHYLPTGQQPMCERCRNTDFTSVRPIPTVLARVKQRLTRREPQLPFWLAVLAEKPTAGAAA